MAKRPALTENNLLAHIFSPKKNALPSGLRARDIAFTKGRKKARVNAYNKMPAIKQEILKRSGQREAFLKGEITFTDAKKALRPKAEQAGVVKPVRQRVPKAKPISRRAALDGQNALAILNTLRRAGKEPNVARVVAGMAFVQEDDIEELTYSQIADRASDPSYEMESGGTRFNPYWYN